MSAKKYPIGDLLSQIVNQVSHTSGETLSVMAEAQVSLQQVLLLTRLAESHPTSATNLASRLSLSLPAISQAIDRLVRLRLVSRVEDAHDRRRVCIEPTAKGSSLLARLNGARAREYSSGLSALDSDTQVRLAFLLKEALRQLDARPNGGN